MRSRLAELARGLAATVTLLVLLVGFPALLVAGVGWPLPAGIPTLDELDTATRSGIDPAAIIKTLAIIGWLAWAQIALAVVVEAVAFARRAPAPHLPVLPGLQAGTGRLLATAALLFGTFTTPRAAAEPLAPPPAVMPTPTLAVESPETASASGSAHAAEPSTEAAAGSATTTYVVQRNDSWWQIAEEHLGDGFRWREVRAANLGRVMPAGQTISATTEIIHEGWEIQVPVDDDSPAAPVVPAAEVVVERGDNLWELSEEHLEGTLDRGATDEEVTPYWLEVIDENRGRLVDPANPSLIHPGQVIHLPGTGDAAPAPPGDEEAAPVPANPDDRPEVPAPSPAVPDEPTTSVPKPSTSVPTSSTRAQASAEHEATDELDDDQTNVPTPGLLGMAGALLGAGFSAAALRRRRQREQELQPGERLADPPEELDEVRAEMVVRGDIDLVERTATSLRSLAIELGRRRSTARARVVQASDSEVEVLLSEPALPAPEPWQAEASGTAWVLQHASADELDLPSGLDRPTHPLLVTLGRPDEDGHLFVDLEAEGLINLTGAPDEIDDFARSAVLELSTSPLAAGASVILCGTAGDLVEGNADRVQRAERWEDVADSVLSWAHQTRDLLVADRWPNAHTPRALTDRVDDVSPVVLVVTDEPDDERFSALCTVISESVIPVIVLGLGTAIEGAATISITDGELRIHGLGLVCRAQGVTESAGSQVTELLEYIDTAEPERVEPPAKVQEPAAKEVDDGPSERYVDPPFDVLVRVLGEIEVVGGHQPLTPKPTAIVTYLALNSPASAERVENAIWSAPTNNRRKRLANTVSETRTALGAEHLPAATDGKYRVGPRVITDLQLLERRLDAAREQPYEQATETLRGALDLVTGPVFTYRHADRHAYSWVDTENWISSTELKVTALAEDLVERYLHIGDHDSAAWAATRGLTAVPTHARLTGALMRVYDAAGDSHAALTVYESYISALEALDLDDGDPDLADLYAAIRSGRREAG